MSNAVRPGLAPPVNSYGVNHFLVDDPEYLTGKNSMAQIMAITRTIQNFAELCKTAIEIAKHLWISSIADHL
jgi:hypothetical protein